MAITNPNEIQIGGDHYKKKKRQPLITAEENELTPMQFSVIKYVERFKDKGGKQDLLKARHVLDMMIQFYYPEENELTPA